MRIGLTYDLRDDYLAAGWSEEATAEFDARETVDALDDALAALGHETVRIGNVRALAARLVAGERWDLVCNIAEGAFGIAREAQVPALLDAWEVPYVFSEPLAMALTLDKAMAKRVVRDAGVATAPFAVVADEADLAAAEALLPAFVKPLAEGTGKGISAASRVVAADELARACRDVQTRFAQPALVERYLPGREFTVGIVGTGTRAETVAVMEIELGASAEPGAYSFENKEHYEGRVRYRLAEDDEARRAAATALAAWRVLGCRDGGRVDLRSDESGEPCFLEVNPLAGLHPVRSDLVILSRLAGLSYRDLVGRILASALTRSVSCRRAA